MFLKLRYSFLDILERTPWVIRVPSRPQDCLGRENTYTRGDGLRERVIVACTKAFTTGPTKEQLNPKISKNGSQRGEDKKMKIGRK